MNQEVNKIIERGKKMKNNISMIKNEIYPVRLHLELRDDYLSNYQKKNA